MDDPKHTKFASFFQDGCSYELSVYSTKPNNWYFIGINYCYLSFHLSIGKLLPEDGLNDINAIFRKNVGLVKEICSLSSLP